MISSTSSFASSTPATSANVTLFCESFSMRAFDLPKDIALPPPACSWRMNRKNISPMNTIGRSVMRVLDQNGEASSFSKYTFGAGEGLVLRVQVVDQLLVGDGAHGFALSDSPLGSVGAGRLQPERIVAVLDLDFIDVPGMDVVQEITERDRLLRLLGLEELPDRQEHDDQDHPEKKRFMRLLHVDLCHRSAGGPGGATRSRYTL